MEFSILFNELKLELKKKNNVNSLFLFTFFTFMIIFVLNSHQNLKKIQLKSVLIVFIQKTVDATSCWYIV